MTELTPDAQPEPTNDERRILGLTETQLAIVLLFVTPALFSSNMITAKATADFFPPVALGFWRWTAALAILACFLGPRLWYRRDAIRREWRDILILGALGMGVCGAFVYIAASTTTATNIGLIYAASPVLIILLAGIFWGEVLRPLQLLGVAICLSGVLIIVARGDLSVLIGLAFTVGDLWVVAAMSGWAVYAVLLRYRPSEMGLTTRFAAIAGGGVMVLLPFTLWEAMSVGAPELSLKSIGIVAFLALVPSLAAYLVYGFVQNVLGAGRASLILYLAPVYNAGLASLLLGEALQAYHLIGAALVLPGIYLSNRTGGKRS